MSSDLAPQPRGLPLATLAYRALTLALAALAAAGQLAWLDALSWRTLGFGALTLGSMGPALMSSVIAGAVVSLVAGALAVVMSVKGSPERGALPMGLALAVWAYLLAYSGMVVLLAPGRESAMRPLFEGHFLLVEALGLASLIRFTSVFPAVLVPGQLREPRGLPYGLGAAQQVRRWLVRPASPWIAALAACAVSFGVNAALGRSLQDAALLTLVDLFRLAALAVVVLNLRHSLLAAGPAGRAGVAWVVLGFTLLLTAVGCVLGGNVLTAATGWELPALNWRPLVLHLGLLGLLWGIAMAVFRRRPAEPARHVRRMAVLGGTAMLTLFLAAGLEMVLSGAVAARFSAPQGVGTALAVVVATLVYGRTRGPLERFLSQTWSGEAEPEPATEVRARPVA